MNFLPVVKLNGEKEAFSAKKVYRSARQSGASKELAEQIVAEVKKKIYPEIKTSKIFQIVRNSLKKERPKAALRFNLKEGIKKLGPTGFPFEKYIGEIFSSNNFKVKLNQHIPGYCSSDYEIDFLAEKNGITYIGECKYRNLFKGKVHSDVALANYARFLDIKKGKFFKGKVKSLLVTNRKFTSKAIKYSSCVGVELLGWNYPRKKGLEYLIDSQELYPITILPLLYRYLAEIFVSKKMVLAKDILGIDVKKFSRKTKIGEKKLQSLKREAEILFNEI